MTSLAKRVEDLEQEVKIIKGSVQKLVMDIRETINNMENPFQGDMQDVGTIEKKMNKKFSDLEEKLREDMVEAVLAEVKDKTGGKIDTGKIKEEILESVSKELEDIRKEILNLSRHIDIISKNGVSTNGITGNNIEQELTILLKKLLEGRSSQYSPPPPIFSREDPSNQPFDEIQKTPKSQNTQQKLDPTLLENLLQWMDKITEKMGKQEFEDLLNFYEAAGYIPPDTKKVLLALSHLSGNIGEIDTFLDLYRLHKTLHPEDTSMDSIVLKMLLQQSKESPWLKIIREEKNVKSVGV